MTKKSDWKRVPDFSLLHYRSCSAQGGSLVIVNIIFMTEVGHLNTGPMSIEWILEPINFLEEQFEITLSINKQQQAHTWCLGW